MLLLPWWGEAHAAASGAAAERILTGNARHLSPPSVPT